MSASRELLFWTLIVLVIANNVTTGWAQDAIVRSEFIYEVAPFPSAHASTIAETDHGLVSAWFGGAAEGDDDVGIWFARHENGTWLTPIEVANGVQIDGTRYPCWNPVLFQPSSGPLLLFYKVGPSPQAWWGLVQSSNDHGRSWSKAVRLPDGILGPIRNKPVELDDGTLLAGSSTEHDGWLTHLERFTLEQKHNWNLDAFGSPHRWSRSASLNDADQFGAIQPTVLVHSHTRLQVLCRSLQGVITQAWSSDGGLTWGPMTRTKLLNPSAGIDALRLHDGRFLLVYNPIRRGRHRLAVALSNDGYYWEQVRVLEDASDNAEYSYPAVIQTTDGLVHVTYTWRRERVRHVVLDPRVLG